MTTTPSGPAHGAGDQHAQHGRDDRPWLTTYPGGVPADIEDLGEPLTAALDRAAAQYPDRIAADFMGAPTTYRELAEQVTRAAGALHALGVRHGDRVALVLPNCTTHVVAFYAILRLGAVVVEHNPTYGAEALEHQLADSGAVVAIVWEKAVADVQEVRARTSLRTVLAVDLSRDLPMVQRLALRLPIARAREARSAMRARVTLAPGLQRWDTVVKAGQPVGVPAPDADDVAALQYTGGTTGVPRGAVLRHRHLVANAVQGQAWTQHTAGTQQTVYAALPFFHAFGLTLGLTYAVRVAATLVIFPRFDAEAVLAAQARRPATFLPGVPPMFERLAALAEKRGADLSSIRHAISGAMALPGPTAEAWERVTGGLLVEGYGMTEMSPVALGNPLSPDRRPGTLGVPFPSTRMRVTDPEDPSREVAVGEQGELMLTGPQMFDGYWQAPEDTAASLVEIDGTTWLRTGDVVVVEPDGFVRLVDRIKEVIISGGFNVYPSQVEDHLRAMPEIEDVAVVGVPGGDIGERVVAAIVLAEGTARVELEAVRAWTERKFARYAQPRELLVVPTLPRSQLGKVLRRVVREQVVARKG